MSVHNSDLLTDMTERVEQVMAGVPATDMHTHLYSPEFGPLLLWGADELLNHHYLIAEALRWGRLTSDQFYSLAKPEQADFVWQNLFVDHTPVSASALGVLETFSALGLNTSSRDLESYRSYFASQKLEDHIDNVFRVAGIESVVMTNDPFDALEGAVWEAGAKPDSRFHTALRLDQLILGWDEVARVLQDWGFRVEPDMRGDSISEVRRFVSEWIERINPLYLGVSLPPTWRYPDLEAGTRILDECVIPAAVDTGRPLALMIGVRRQVNPGLRLAGDSVGKANVASLERLCQEHSTARFLVTMLSRENQHELCVAARKFPNLMPFGCWWFLNIPYLIDEMTRMRLELVGQSVIPHHSDVRILEQVIPKWSHARHFTAAALADKYSELEKLGWKITDSDIRRDAEDLLSRNFWRFIGR